MSLQDFLAQRREQRRSLQETGKGGGKPLTLREFNAKANFVAKINQARRDQGIVPGDSPLVPLIDPQEAERFGRSAPGIIGDVAGPVLGAGAELTSPAELLLMATTAGFGAPIAGALRTVPKIGRALGMFAEPLAKSFPKALAAETGVGIGAVLGAQEVLEHTENLHPAARIPLTIAGGVVAGGLTAGSPAVIRKTIQGAKIAGDLRYVDEAAEAFVKSNQTAEDPSFTGTVNPGGSYAPDPPPARAAIAAPETEKIYHGTRATDTSTFINENGDLVLRKSSNFGGRQDGVSFTDSLESAQEYATRSTTPSGESLAAVRQYDGTVFEIDKDAAGDLVPEAMGELFADGRDVIIPKGSFNVLDTKSLAPKADELLNELLGGELQQFSTRFLERKLDELDSIPVRTADEDAAMEEVGSYLEELSGGGIDESSFADVPIRDRTFENTSLARTTAVEPDADLVNVDAIREHTKDLIQRGEFSDEFSFHVSNNVKGVIREGLTAGGLSGSPLTEQGYGDVVHVFRNSDLPKGDLGADISFGEGFDHLNPPKPVATFTWRQLGVDPDSLTIGARAEEEGIFREPSAREMLDDKEFAEWQQELAYLDTRRVAEISAAYPTTPAKTPQQILAENTEKFLDESHNRKKVLRDENIADIEDPILRSINRQVEEARVRQVLGSGVVDGPVSNIVGPPGAEGRQMRNVFELSDDARIRNVAPIFGKFFRTINSSDARRLRNVLDLPTVTTRQRNLINSTLSAIGFDQSVGVQRVVFDPATGTNRALNPGERAPSTVEHRFDSSEELVRFVNNEGRSPNIREATELTAKNTHTFRITSNDGAPIADVIMTKSKGVAADGTPLFEYGQRGLVTDKSKLGKKSENVYEVLIEPLSDDGQTMGLSAKDRVNKQSRRLIMEVADEIFRQTDADVLTGTRVTGSSKGKGLAQKITKSQVDRFFNRSVITGDEAVRMQDAKNNWNRPSSTDDAVIAQMENDRLARKIASGEGDAGEPPPPGSFTGWDPEDLTPRARASENALGDSTEINTWEPWGMDAQRLFTASRTYEASAVVKGVEEGAKFAKARGIKKWNKENALPLFRALHNPDKWLNKLSPEMQEIYYDLKRNWVYKEENDMFTFLAFAAEKDAAQFKIDMEHMASRFMAHPHYFNRIWRFHNQVEGETLHKLWKTSGTARDPRPGFETTMEHSRNARDFDEMIGFGFEPALWDPYKMAAQRRMSGVEYRESIRFLTRLAERGLEDHTGAKAGDPRWAVPSGIPLFNGVPRVDADGVVTRGPIVHVPTDMANWMEQVWTSPHTIFSDPILFDKSIRQWSTIAKLTKLAASPFQHIDMLWRGGGALMTPTALYSPVIRGGSDRLGLHGLKLPDLLGGQSLDKFSVPTGRLPGPMKIPSLMVDLFKVQFFLSARRGTSDFMISPTPINKDYPLLWQDLVQKHGLTVHGDYSVLAEDMRDGIIKILQPKTDPETGKKVWLYPGAPMGAAKTMTRAINKLSDFFVSGLFDGVYSVVMKYAIENFILPAMRRNHPDWSVDQVGAAVAENANLIFSALGNFQTFLKNFPPALQQLLHVAAFSTGETEGLMRSASRAFVPRTARRKAVTGGEGVREIPASTQRGIPYRRAKKLVMSPHWGIHAEHMLGMFVVLSTAANVIHKFATGDGDFDKGEWLPESKYNPININDPYAVIGSVGFNGGFLSPMNPWGKGRNGVDTFLDLVGQQDTAFKWMLSPLDAATARYNVLPRSIYNQLRGEVFSGIPMDTVMQRVGSLVSDIAFPISLVNAIAALRKAHPDLYNISAATLPGEDRLSVGQLYAQGGGQNIRAIQNRELEMQIESLSRNDPLRKQLEWELELRSVESAIKGNYNWSFIKNKTLKKAYEHWKGDSATLGALDKAVWTLTDREERGEQTRRVSTLMPSWRYEQLGYKNYPKRPSDTVLGIKKR